MLPDGLSMEAAVQASLVIKYEGYIRRQERMVRDMKRLDEIALAPDFDYASLNALSAEARQKLAAARPSTIGAASRIPGVRMADVSLLIALVKRREQEQTTGNRSRCDQTQLGTAKPTAAC
jgi:tRNA uridine 5-carboxymethylaminomethyl modification enzyme